MKKLFLTIKENWNDPVWSRVIAAVIIAIGGFILTTLYSLVRSLILDDSFVNVLNEVYATLSSDISIDLWMVVVFILIYFTLVFKPIVIFINQVVTKFVSHRKEVEDIPKELPRATEHSTSLFHYRMARAFPGVSGVKWFDNPKLATKRLEILLQEPLRFSSSSIEAEGDPFWWFRGGSELFIEKFTRVGSKKVLMNIDQLKIKRIAAFRGSSYYKDFVYVEVEGEKQTGLYNLTKEDIQRHIDDFGYCWEEYGLIRNRLGWTTPIRREHYDDGATVIRGEVRNARDAKLRVRYLSAYNFIIAAKGSPYNSMKFDQGAETYLNGILKGEVEPEAFFDFLKGFTKHEQ